MRGFGDLVFYFTKYTGIKWIWDKIWTKDCGCDERREKLNVKLPFD